MGRRIETISDRTGWWPARVIKKVRSLVKKKAVDRSTSSTILTSSLNVKDRLVRDRAKVYQMNFLYSNFALHLKPKSLTVMNSTTR